MLSTKPDNLNDGIRDAEGGIYAGDRLLKFDDRKAVEYHVKEGTRVICDSAFKGTDIQTVVLPPSIEAIGQTAFAGCRYLDSINIPEGVTEFPSFVFRSCAALTKLELPATVNSVGVQSLSPGLEVLILSSKIRFHELAFDDSKPRLIVVPDDLVSYYKDVLAKREVGGQVLSMTDYKKENDNKSVSADTDTKETSDKGIQDTPADPLDGFREGKWLLIKLKKLQHSSDTITDTRITQNPILVYDTNNPQIKALTVESGNPGMFMTKANHILKQIGQAPGFLMLQFDAFESNIPELEALGNKEKVKYAFEITKLYRQIIFAKAPKPIIDKMTVAIEFEGVRRVIFELAYGKITNFIGANPGTEDEDIIMSDVSAISFPTVYTGPVEEEPAEEGSFLSGIINAIKGFFK